MVKQVVKMVYQEVRGLHQAAYVLAIFTFGSQLLALFRDRLLAHQFGAGVELDLYYAAFRIPDLLYVLFASTLSVYVLIPFVSARLRSDEDTTAARQLLSQVFSFFLIVYSFLALVLWFLAPFLVPVLVPGLVDESTTITTLLRILLLQPLFLGVSSLFGVLTQLEHRFVLFSLSPLVYNLGIIAGIIFLYPVFGLVGLVYGVLLGAIGHLAIQVPLWQTSNLRFSFTTQISLPLLKSVLLVSLPRALTLALHQLVLLALVVVASLMTVGSVAVFQFAYNLQSVPLAVIGASYSIAAFPLLADLFTQGKYDNFRFYLTSAMRHIIFWAVPTMMLFVVIRAQIVRVILGTGAFSWADTRLTAAVLAILCLSLFAQALNLLLVRAFYASGRTMIPFLITLGGTILTIGTTYCLHSLYQSTPATFDTLFDLLRISEVGGQEVVVIALGYSIFMVIQTVLMLAVAARVFSLALNWLWLHSLRSLGAGLGGGILSYLALNFLVEGINQGSFIGIFLQGLLSGLAGLVGVFAVYYLTRSPELQEIARSLHSRFRKTTVLAAQDDVL